jgi:hypothetical protein
MVEKYESLPSFSIKKEMLSIISEDCILEELLTVYVSTGIVESIPVFFLLVQAEIVIAIVKKTIAILILFIFISILIKLQNNYALFDKLSNRINRSSSIPLPPYFLGRGGGTTLLNN